MFSSRLKSSDSIIDCLLIYDVSHLNPAISYCYPPEYSSELLKTLPNFILPCNHRSSISEHYTLLFTDEYAKIEFVVCLFLPLPKYIVCIKSVNPWFGLFHSLLNIINEHMLFYDAKRKELDIIVQKLYCNAGLFLIDAPPPHPFSRFSSRFPDPRCHPYCQRYILEYYNALSFSNWLFIFEAMLLEKSVIFLSRQVNRTTSCILASLSLIYPLTWVHLIYPILPASHVDFLSCPTPFIAGIHSCMLDSAEKALTSDIILVNLDENKISFVGKMDIQMPGALRRWLVNRRSMNPPEFKNLPAPYSCVASRAAGILVKPWLEIMVAILGGYRESIKQVISSQPENIERSLFPSVSTSSSSHGSDCSPSIRRPILPPPMWLFDRQCFIESRGAACRPYLTRILDSQMVIEFMQSRIELINSNVGIIPSDDFEDLLSCTQYSLPSSVVQVVLKGRNNLEELLKKLHRLRDKSKKSAASSKRLTRSQTIDAASSSTGPVFLYHQHSMENFEEVFEKEVDLLEFSDVEKDRRGREEVPTVDSPRVVASRFITEPSSSSSCSHSTVDVGEAASAGCPTTAAASKQDLINFQDWSDAEKDTLNLFSSYWNFPHNAGHSRTGVASQETNIGLLDPGDFGNSDFSCPSDVAGNTQIEEIKKSPSISKGFDNEDSPI